MLSRVLMHTFLVHHMLKIPIIINIHKYIKKYYFYNINRFKDCKKNGSKLVQITFN